MKNKKIILALSIIIVLILITIGVIYALNGCGTNKEEKFIETSEQIIGGNKDDNGCLIAAGYSWCETKQKCLRTWEEECTTNLDDQVSNWNLYKNEKFSFELKFPDTWDGYIVTEGDYPDYSYVAFSFKDGHQPFAIFSVVRYSQKQWEVISQNTALLVLKQLDGGVLVCDGCCKEDGEFYGGGQFDEYQIERCKEASQIIKTFKIVE